MDTDTKRMEAAIAKQIRVELAERDMTQADLANAIGMGRVVVNHYLQGHRSMTAQTFFKVAEALGLLPSDILGRAQERLSASPAGPALDGPHE